MRKFDNFISALNVLTKTDIERAKTDEIYRTGILSQFNLTFELSWKALQAVMRLHSVLGVETGSPHEILKLGYKVGFIMDEKSWLGMLKDRNSSVHIYSENEADEIVLRVVEEYVPAFQALGDMLREKLAQTEDKISK